MQRLASLVSHVVASDVAVGASETPHPSECGGTAAAGFEAVEAAFRGNFSAGTELGAQCCVYHKGSVVVDLWGKAMAAPYPEPMENQVGREVSETLAGYGPDSLQQVFSSTKNCMALCISICVDRGLLSYGDTVAQHWPEFAQQGKVHITVADVLRHEAGLVRFHRTATPEDAVDWGSMAALIEESPPIEFMSKYNPPPNPDETTGRRGYHAVSRGLILNCLLLRVDPSKRSMSQFLAEEIAGPLEADVFCGMPEELQDAHHIADMAPFIMR